MYSCINGCVPYIYPTDDYKTYCYNWLVQAKHVYVFSYLGCRRYKVHVCK